MKTILSILFLLASVASVRAETLKVSTLAPNEEIRIEINSTGCFHSSNRSYSISGRSSSMLVSEHRFAWNEAKKKADDLGVHAHGAIALSAADRAGIDALFAFYRMRVEGGCTSVDGISIEYRRDGKAIGSESFVDASCATLSIELYEQHEGMRSHLSPEAWSALRRAAPLWKFESRLKKKDA